MNKTIRSSDDKAADNLKQSLDNVLEEIAEGNVDWQAWAKGDKFGTTLTIRLHRPDLVALAEAKLDKAKKEVAQAEAQLKEEQRQLAAESTE